MYQLMQNEGKRVTDYLSNHYSTLPSMARGWHFITSLTYQMNRRPNPHLTELFDKLTIEALKVSTDFI